MWKSPYHIISIMLQAIFFAVTCNEHYKHASKLMLQQVKMKGMKEMDTNHLSDRKKEITKTTWQYLLKTGLTHASIGDLCRETKLAQSSLYHWFENKDDIWVSAGKYGLSKVVDALFKYTLDHTDNVREYFDTLLSEVEKYKYELRIAIQITTSPIFGKLMRDKSKDFRLLYEKYAEKIINIFSCTHLQAEIFIYSIIAFVIDYAIWDDPDKTQMLLDNLYGRVAKNLHID